MPSAHDHAVRHRVELAITGARVSPEEVSLGELAEVLVGLDKTFRSYLRETEAEAPEDTKVCLVSIERGSERLVLSVDPPFLPAVVGVTSALARDGVAELPPATLMELRVLHGALAKKDWEIEFQEDSSLQLPFARLGREPLPEPPTPVPVQGPTTLLTRCLRVGGVEPRAELRLPTREKLLYASLSEETARELAKRLYDEVALEGIATWDPETWEVVDFRVTAVTPYQRTDPVLAFKELAEAASGRWDGVDPIEYVRELREDN